MAIIPTAIAVFAFHQLSHDTPPDQLTLRLARTGQANRY